MGDQANFIVIQPKSSDPSPKRINNDRSLEWKYRVCVCLGVWVYVCRGGGGTGLQDAWMNIYHW